MNVAYILSSATGGGFKSFINSLDELMKKGLSPLVVLPMENEIHTLLSSRGIPTIIVKYRYNTYPPCTTMKDKLLFIPRLIARIAVNYNAVCIISKMLSDKNVDIIHTNVSIIGIGHSIAKKLHIPHIYHIREYGDLDFGYKYFPTRKHFIKQLSDDYSIFITKDIQKYFLQDQNSKSSVIYNGIQKKESKLPEKTNSDYFLYLGDVLPAKGTGILVKAYSKYAGMTKNPLPLYIVGRIANNSYAEEIHRYIQNCYMEKRVFFLPKQKDVKTLIQKACAIVIPSIKEGFGRCMPEAMFAGCLAIANNSGGSKEQLDNARNLTGQEIALHYESPSELAGLLLQAEKMTEEEKEKYTRLAFFVVNELYSNEENGNNVYAFYKHVLNTYGKL